MDVAEKTQLSRFLMMRVHTGCCAAIPLQSVLEISRPLPVESIAAAPAFVKGVAVVRSRPIPVIDLAATLGIACPSEAARFVMLKVGQRNIAVAVESVIGITDLEGEFLQQSPPLLRDAPGEVVESIGSLDGDLLFVLNLGRLVSTDLIDSLSGGAGVE